MSDNYTDSGVDVYLYSDEVLLKNGGVTTEKSLAETKKFHHINHYVQDDRNGEDYSNKVYKAMTGPWSCRPF